MPDTTVRAVSGAFFFDTPRPAARLHSPGRREEEGPSAALSHLPLLEREPGAMTGAIANLTCDSIVDQC